MVSKLKLIEPNGIKVNILGKPKFLTFFLYYSLNNYLLLRNLNPTYLYRRRAQRDTLTSLLGSRKLAEKYVHMTNDNFLSKGHLVAKADFLYGAHQRATFQYINAAPQWATLNGNNWNSLENDVRSFSIRINKDLEVYTGTYVL